MASKKITMYMEKNLELSQISEKLAKKMKSIDAEYFVDSEDCFDETKILHFLGERWYVRTGSYTGLSVLLIEYRGYQKAEIVSLGGKECFFSLGAENNFADHAADALQELGFQRK